MIKKNRNLLLPDVRRAASTRLYKSGKFIVSGIAGLMIFGGSTVIANADNVNATPATEMVVSDSTTATSSQAPVSETSAVVSEANSATQTSDVAIATSVVAQDSAAVTSDVTSSASTADSLAASNSNSSAADSVNSVLSDSVTSEKVDSLASSSVVSSAAASSAVSSSSAVASESVTSSSAKSEAVSSEVVSATSSAISQLANVKANNNQNKPDVPSLAQDENIKTHMDMINNLIYLPSFWQSMGMSVTQWASYQDPVALANEMRQSLLFPEATIKAFINSLVSDYNFWSQMQVTNVTAKLFDSGSLVHYFTLMYKNDEIIAYQGTSGDDEWLDNAEGLTQTDTVEQGTAQMYFDAVQQTYNADHAKKVYVTGHSKGGNKAMYVGVTRGDQIEHVYAFDGQGFGKEFFRKYSDQIVKNQSKITLISNNEDYVNIMMWPIAGEKIYIQSQATFGLADMQALIGLKSNDVFGLLNEIGHNMLMDRFGAIHSPVSMLTVDPATNTVKMADETSQNGMISMLHRFVETGMMYLDKDQLNYFADKAVSLFISPEGAARLGLDKLVKPVGFDVNMGLTVAAFLRDLTPSELLSVAESLPAFISKF